MDDNTLNSLQESIKTLQDSGVFKLGKGKFKEIKCPGCGGHANAATASVNGHLRVWCNDCDFLLIV